MNTPRSPHDRLLAATYACVARYGIGKTTVEDIAREAGLSRATVYRHFPGGKEQLVRETVAWEAGHFIDRLTTAVADADDFATLLERAVMMANEAFEEHAVLQKILQTEPERLLPQLTVESERLLLLIRTFLLPYLSRERDRLPPGLDVQRGAEHVARLLLSFIGAPGRWDLANPAHVRELVRTELLAGILPVTGP